jgi:hypothetical protein
MIDINTKVSVLADHEHPLKSANTHLVAAACTSGAELSPDGYLDTIEQGAEGKPRRTVVWVMQSKEISFGSFEAEKISTQEFLRRWNDKAWCAANPDHPIVFMRYYQQTLAKLRDAIRDQTPTIKVTRGGRAAYIPASATEEQRAKLLAKL